ncbi:MAG: HypC/HybG/HupF family hydrogenase formation chaperone [Verrucomicrobia bacterium]|nr:HypC/HybG/HupF family hydrogenase formation chaperone [Verrucomicrobiota bacterium]MBV9297980.1 HypC/HybG/HupF family hydrogenase formation chaperone [Verrucomicrobiota bacterium]
MNLIYGEIVAISQEGDMRVGKIRIGGAMRNVSLDLVTVAEIGDSVLVCDGVAIARVDPEKTNGEKLCV